MKQFLKSSVSTFALLGMLSNFAPSYGMEAPEEDALEVKKILTPLCPPEKKTSLRNKKIEREKKLEENHFQTIPDNLLLHIFSYFNSQTAQAASQVCPKFAYLILEKGLHFNDNGDVISFIPHPLNIFSLLQNMVSENPPELSFLDPQSPNSQKKSAATKKKNVLIESKFLALANDPTSFPFLARLFTHLDPLIDFQAVEIASTLVKKVPGLQAFLKKAMQNSPLPVDQFFEILDNPTGLPHSGPVADSVDLLSSPADSQKVRQNLMIAKLLKDAGDMDAQARLDSFAQYVTKTLPTRAFTGTDFEKNRLLLEQLLRAAYMDDGTIIAKALHLMTNHPSDPADLDEDTDGTRLAFFENFGKYYFSKFSQLTPQIKNMYFDTLLTRYKQHRDNQKYRLKILATLNALYELADKTDVTTLLSLVPHYIDANEVEKCSAIVDPLYTNLTDKQVSKYCSQLVTIYRHKNNTAKVLEILEKTLKKIGDADVERHFYIASTYVAVGHVEKGSQLVDSLFANLTAAEVAKYSYEFIEFYRDNNNTEKVLETLDKARRGTNPTDMYTLNLLAEEYYRAIRNEEDFNEPYTDVVNRFLKDGPKHSYRSGKAES